METQKESQLPIFLVDDIFSVRGARVVNFHGLEKGGYDLRLVERGLSTYYSGISKEDITKKLGEVNYEKNSDWKAYVMRR